MSAFYYFLKISLLCIVSFFCAHLNAFSDNENITPEQKLISEKITKLTKKLAKSPQKALIAIKQFRESHSGKLTSTHNISLLEREAWAHMYSNNYSAALATINKINPIATAEDNNYFFFIIDSFKGMLYGHMDEGQEALKYHLKAYEYLKKDNSHPKAKAINENNIGYTSVQLGFCQEAIPYLDNFKNYFLAEPEKQRRLAIAYNNLGEAYFCLKNYQKAYLLHQQSLDIRQRNKLEFHASYSYHNLALIFHVRKEYDKAKEYLLKAIKIREKSNFKNGVFESQLALAHVYSETNEVQLLANMLELIISNAQKAEKYKTLAAAYKIQQTLFQKQKDFEKALTAAINYQESLTHVQHRKTDSHLASYITDLSTVTKDLNILALQKSNEIQALTIKNEQQRAYIILTAGFIIVIILLIFLRILQRKKKNIQTVNQNLSNTLDKLKDAQNKLIETEKMSALTTLVTGMAHQVNTPLGIGVTAVSHIKQLVDNFTQAVSSGQIKKSTMESMLNELEQGSQLALDNMERAAKLIDQFKKISVELECATQEQFKLVSFLINITEKMTFVNAGKKPIINISGDELLLTGYSMSLEKVIYHLIQNSMDHGFTKTKKPKIDICVYKKTNSIEILFKDNGSGINSDLIGKIFDPFYTTNIGNKNVGIGLSIVYNLVVQLMKGTISYEPSEGKGSNFRIVLPINTNELSSINNSC